MPCHDEGAERESRHELQGRLNLVTRTACDMRTILRRHNLESELAAETREWIAQHDDWDRRRIAEEEASGARAKARKAALDKLSMDDRRVLGL